MIVNLSLITYKHIKYDLLTLRYTFYELDDATTSNPSLILSLSLPVFFIIIEIKLTTKI